MFYSLFLITDLAQIARNVSGRQHFAEQLAAASLTGAATIKLKINALNYVKS